MSYWNEFIWIWITRSKSDWLLLTRILCKSSRSFPQNRQERYWSIICYCLLLFYGQELCLLFSIIWGITHFQDNFQTSSNAFDIEEAQSFIMHIGISGTLLSLEIGVHCLVRILKTNLFTVILFKSQWHTEKF